MKKILIVLNAVKYNRGSEALIRGLVRICKKGNNELYLVSSELDFENTVRIEGIDMYLNRYSYKSKYAPKKIIAGGIKKFFKKNELATYIKCSKMVKCAENMDVVIIIGADNYDKSYRIFSMMHDLNCLLRKRIKGKFYLYDCSIAKEDIDTNVINDLKLFDRVTVRETISLSNLAGLLDKDKLCYYPDPAFLMEAEKISLPKGWIEENMIGVNLSNLIMNNVYGSNRYMILESYYKLIEFILEETTFNIVLIPHVMQGKDLDVLKLLYDKYLNSGRVILVDDETLSAPRLKYLISKCRLFVGARTHSTIAAYSSYVPTLVLGYSVKSVGIARDLFGTDEKYVISSHNIENGEELKNGFQWLLENEIKIRESLEQRIPKYKEEAWKATELLE